jgi:uncharacterized protein (UPF0276 family)
MVPPQLGVGLTFHPELGAFIEAHSDLIDVIELEPQALWLSISSDTKRFRAPDGSLERVAALPQAKLVHSVGIPVGGSRLGDARQLPLLQQTITRLESPWCSEHLSFNVAHGPHGPFFTGFLLPPRLTWEGVEVATASVQRFAMEINCPLAIETGVSYLRPRRDELRDGEFVAAVADAADCGILLDLHNIWTNERNGRQTVDSYLADLPLARVWELHLAGGQEHAGFWLDAHSGRTPGEVLEIAAVLVPALPNLGAIIFELTPEQLSRLGDAGLRAELEAMHELWESLLRQRGKHHGQETAASITLPVDTSAPYPPDPQTWEDALGALAVGLPAGGDLADELSRDPGLGVTRDLVDEARAGLLAAGLRLTIRLLLLTLGDGETRNILKRFSTTEPPRAFAADECLAFGPYLAKLDLEVPYLDQVLAFEMAVLRASVRNETTKVDFRADPAEILGALAAGRLPSAREDGEHSLEIASAGGQER